MKRLVPWLLAPLSIFFVLMKIGPVGGQFGHDYGHYFTRLLIGKDFLLKNGLTVPHFTPYLCGGMPFYADPQAISHSLQQGFVLVFSAWVATQITFGVFFLLGYIGFYFLSREILKLSSIARHLTALLFVLNGFTFMHLSVGHVTHYPFLLAPWVLFALFRRTFGSIREVLFSSSLLILISSYTFYSGGLHVLVVFTGMGWIILPFLLYRKHEQKEVRDLVKVLCITVVGFLFVSAGKIASVASFSSVFHEQGIDLAPLSILSLFSRYFWFNPIRIPAFVLFGKWAFGPWEYIAFVSKLSVLGIFVAFPIFLWRSKSSVRAVMLVSLFFAYYLVLLATGRGGNASLPFFQHYHNPLKILAAFIPIWIGATGYAFDRMAEVSWVKRTSPAWRASVTSIIILIVLAEFGLYSTILSSHPGFRGIPKSHGELAGTLPAVMTVGSRQTTDLEEAKEGRTSLQCYEALFGYRNEEMLASSLKVGDVSAVEGNRFNLHHPACFLYGQDLRCRPWDRIPSHERAAFERFRRGLVVAEWVPIWQRRLDTFSFLSFILAVTSLLWPRSTRRRFSPKVIEGTA